MTVEPTISVGNIINASVVLVTLFATAWRLSSQVKEMQWKMDMIWKWYAKEHNLDNDKEHK